MQSLEAKSQYRNSFHCAYRIFTEEGVVRFWTGTTPRLIRLVVCDFGSSTRRLPEITFHSSRVGLSSPCTNRLSPSSAVDLDCGPPFNCILPHRIFLSIKPPDLRLVIPDLAHTISHRPRFRTLTAPTSPSNSPLAREYRSCSLRSILRSVSVV